MEIGQTLTPALLVWGSVRRQGERLRVTVQLTEFPGNGTQLWAEP